jgi:hypothetical protein
VLKFVYEKDLNELFKDNLIEEYEENLKDED